MADEGEEGGGEKNREEEYACVEDQERPEPPVGFKGGVRCAGDPEEDELEEGRRQEETQDGYRGERAGGCGSHGGFNLAERPPPRQGLKAGQPKRGLSLF